MYSEAKYNLPLIEGAVHVHGAYIYQINGKQLYCRLYLYRDIYSTLHTSLLCHPHNAVLL